MIPKRLFLRLSVLVLSFTAMQATTIPNPFPHCPIFAILCSTDSSDGHCGFGALYNETCGYCYGNDGSVSLDLTDCTNI